MPDADNGLVMSGGTAGLLLQSAKRASRSLDRGIVIFPPASFHPAGLSPMRCWTALILRKVRRCQYRKSGRIVCSEWLGDGTPPRFPVKAAFEQGASRAE